MRDSEFANDLYEKKNKKMRKNYVIQPKNLFEK